MYEVILGYEGYDAVELPQTDLLLVDESDVPGRLRGQLN